MFFYNESDSEVSQVTPAPSDPYFYNTSLLLKMDSDFSDSSVHQHTATTVGNTTISSAESKYGGASGYFDGTGDYLQFLDNETFNFGTGEFTIEAWVKPTQNLVPTNGTAIYSQSTQGAVSDSAIYTGISLQGAAFYITDGAGWDYNATYSGTISQDWHHVAFVRQGDSIKVFLDGVNVASTNIPSNFAIGNSSRSVLIGKQESHPNSFAGHIDDVRITKGVARYTANFTPPDSHPTTGPSEIVSTDLQLHLDAGDTNSYSGTGTTWYDLSGNGYHHTLTNPTYEQFVGAYGFNINEDGKGIRDAGSTFTYGEQYTIQVWAAALPNSQAPDFRTLLRSEPNDHALLIQKDTNIIGYYDNDNGGGFVSYGLNAGTLGLENNWALYSIVGNAGSTTLYINGLSHSGTVPKTLSGNQHRSIGATTPNPVQPFGRIAVVTTYSRTLSSAEILQNFEVTKSRFGL